MRYLSTVAALALLAATSGPAHAQMKTSKPAAAPAPAAAPSAVAAGVDEYRPTSFLGIEKAQVLGNGAAVMSLGGTLSGSLGLGSNMEAGGMANLALGLNPNSLSLPVGLSGKMVLANQGGFTVAGAAQVNLALSSAAANPLTLGASLMLPVSFWSVGPGELHFMPTLNLGVLPGAFSGGVGIGYEMPIMPWWYLELADTVLTSGNTLTVGTRVYLSPNLTADVGSLTINGSNVSINLVGISATFGGKTGALLKAWGL